MAVFRPQANKHVCTLNFDDKFTYELQLHEDTARTIASAADKQLKIVEKLKDNDEDALDKAYNAALDAIDEILGEGAGADIMSLYEKPSVLDIADVINYIGAEYKTAYEERLNTHKAAGTVPAAQRGRR